MRALSFLKAVGELPFSNRLFHLIFFVTGLCNARCKMCFYLDVIEQAAQNLHEELSLEEIQQFLRGAGRIPIVSISGGEPFLRRDFGDIVDYAARINDPLMISVPSNCFAPEKIAGVFSRLCEAHPRTQFELQMSLDGLKDVHDEIRKVPGLFDKVVATNEMIAESQKTRPNLKVKITITYSSFNQDSAEELIDYVDRDLTFDRIVLAMAHGTCSEETKIGLDRQRYQQLLRRADAINAARAREVEHSLLTKVNLRVKSAKERLRDEIDQAQSLGRHCNAGRKIAVVSERGEVYACEPLRFSLGNLKDHDYDLMGILNGGRRRFLEKYPSESCHCDWGCGQNMAVVSNPRFWPRVLRNSRG
jgi:MoaA/NifB/PqqE/SkfB family radical SAM enzyme